MFKTILKQSWIITILIGTILYALGVHYLGNNLLTSGTVNYGSWTWTYWKIDIVTYLSNLEKTIGSIGDIIDQRTFADSFPKPPTNVDIVSWLKFIVNMLIYLVNWVIFLTAEMTWTFVKTLLYPIFVIGALLGINISKNNFYDAITMIYQYHVSYIKPI